MQRHRVAIAAVLLAVLCMGSKCNLRQKWKDVEDAEISLMREVLLLAEEVVHAVDDIQTDNYTGTDEDFARLERGVCVLETMQEAIEGAWGVVRVYELAKAEVQRKKEGGGDPLTLEEALSVHEGSILDYVFTIAGLGITARNLAAEWGKKPPKSIDKLIRLAGNFLGKEVTEPAIDCSKVLGDVGPSAMWPTTSGLRSADLLRTETASRGWLAVGQ